MTLIDPAVGQIVVDAADGDIAVGQAGAANFLEEIENHLPFAEGVEERAERAEIEAIGPHGDEMAGDAVKLADDARG